MDGKNVTYMLYHVAMTGYGKWEPRWGIHRLSEYILCELSSNADSSQHITLNGTSDRPNNYFPVNDHPF